ncbi:MAG TPA: choice-of-anchor D domain-containing protein [Chloroflexia bacterium]|nr:choice-of-anchor D domain-containing protein [Chloroflexia bacterium]
MSLLSRTALASRFSRWRRPLTVALLALILVPLLTACYNSDPIPGSTIDVGSAKIGSTISTGMKVFNSDPLPYIVTDYTIDGLNKDEFRVEAVITNPLAQDPNSNAFMVGAGCNLDPSNTALSSLPPCGSLPLENSQVSPEMAKKIEEYAKLHSISEDSLRSTDNLKTLSTLQDIFPTQLLLLPHEVTLNIYCTPAGTGLRTATLNVSYLNDILSGGGGAVATPDSLLRLGQKAGSRTAVSGIETASYPLTCTGLAQNSGYNSSPAPNGTLDFGVTKPRLPLTGKISVFNTGRGDLTVSNPVISGPDAADFTLLTQNFPLTLPANSETQQIQLQCKPSSTDVSKATLTMTTNDPNYETVSYSLKCSGAQPEPKPADLTLSLTITPDRLVANNPDNLIGYTFKVKNVGEGESHLVKITIPVDPNLVVGYTKFDNDSTWVTETTDSEVLIKLPNLLSGEWATGTVFFRPKTSPAPAPGTKITARFSVRYDDATGVGFERQSNSAEVIFAEPGENMSAENVQVITPAEASGHVGDKFQFQANFFAPDEKVTVWLTGPDGHSKQLTNVDVRAQAKGQYLFTVDTAGMQPGTYYVALRGNRSEAKGNAKLVLAAPVLTPDIATVTVGQKATFSANYIVSGETVTAWLTGPDGKSVNLSGEMLNGPFVVTLDSTKLTPGNYTLVVKGNNSGLQGSANLTVVAPAQ